MPAQPVIYAFDNEAFPYGELDDEYLIERVCQIIQCVVKEESIALVVIACNTASTLVLPVLRKLLRVPVVGVVPAIKPAANLSVTKKIGVLATPATVRRQYTQDLIAQFASDCDVTLVAATELVQMAESKIRGGDLDSTCIRELFEGADPQIDVWVLGCTHFPLLKDEIASTLSKECVLVDSGKAVAVRVHTLLNQIGKLNTQPVTHKNQVLSTSAVFEEEKLNQQLSAFGFVPITRVPLS